MKEITLRMLDENTSKGINVATLERMAARHEVSTDVFIQRLLVAKFQQMLPDDYLEALIQEQANEVMDELSLKHYFKSVIEAVLNEFEIAGIYPRETEVRYTYVRSDIKVIVDYKQKRKGEALAGEASAVLHLFINNKIDKEIIKRYAKWNHSSVTVEARCARNTRAWVYNNEHVSDISFQLKF